MMIRLIPKVFFERMDQGLDLFVGCLGFEVLHQDGQLAVVGRDGAKAYVVESPEYAAKDRPEISIETDTIEELHQEVSSKRPDMLHPNLPSVTERPWGAGVRGLGQDRGLRCVPAMAKRGMSSRVAALI